MVDHAGSMAVVEFQLERTINAPIAVVFARLADINGHNEWMPKRGSILRHTHQTSPGESNLGTTFLDKTVFGPTPGQIVEFEPPHTLVYHWWDRSKTGKLKAEGWPGYSLHSESDNSTLVRHHAKLHTYRLYRMVTPLLRKIAVRERTVTMDALKRSFETTG